MGIPALLVVLAAAHGVIPERAHDLWFVALIALSILGIWLGVRANGAVPGDAWFLLAGSLTVYGLSEVGFVLASRAWQPDSPAAMASRVVGLLCLPFAVRAVAKVIQPRPEVVDREAAYDAAVITITLAYLCWTAFLLPLARVTDPLSVSFLGSTALMLTVLLIATMLIARALDIGGSPSLYLLAISTIAGAMATGVYQTFEREIAWSSAPVSRVFTALSWAAVVAAVAHPSFHREWTPNPNGRLHSPVWRIGLLLGALALINAIHFGGMLGWWPRAHPDFAGAISALSALVLTGRRLVIVWTARDVALQEVRDREAHYRLQSVTDSLTGMPNRQALMDQLAICTSDECVAGTVSVLFVDLDQFKVVNDSLGHQAGDEMIVEVAKRIGMVGGRDDFVARIGGDEFVLINHGDGTNGDPAQLASRLNTALTEPLLVRGHDVSAGASIGIAVNRRGDQTPMSLLRDADTAMYRAKAAGRNGYAFFDDAWGEHSATRLKLESALRRALADEGLQLHYQPIVNLRTGDVTGYEGLLRWPRSADYGLQHVPRPIDLIQVAEASGLIVPLGEWVVRRACADLRRMQTSMGRPELKIGINVSGVQLRQPGFGDVVRDAVAANGLGRHDLVVELTESTVIEDIPSAHDTLRGLRDAGIPLAMDDFGTGYSALVNLKRLPFAIMKIDGGFAAGLPDDPEQVAIVKACVGIAKALQLDIVAEGVESAEQLAALRDAGCGYGQGFFLGRPMTADALIAAHSAGHVSLS